MHMRKHVKVKYLSAHADLATHATTSNNDGGDIEAGIDVNMAAQAYNNQSSRSTSNNDGGDLEAGIDNNMAAQAYNNQSSSCMDPELYRAIRNGNLLQSNIDSLGNQLSPQRNTVLHLAASLGHCKLVGPILLRCPELFSAKNSTNNIALHLAAASGSLSTLKKLLDHTSGNLAALVDENSEMNTALHVAMKYHHYHLAMLLVEKYPEVSTRPNAQNMSPLFMAAEAGQLELVNAMMLNIGAVNIGTVEGKSVVHAAIKSRNLDVLKAVLPHESTYPSAYDEEGRKALSFASSIGYFDGVCYFLNLSCKGIYIRDRDGSFPIHSASKTGHVNIIQEFLQHCPDSKELLDKHDMNILHVAVLNGKVNVVNYVLKKPELAMLINQRNKIMGDTPLQLATMLGHARIVHILTWNRRVNLESRNNEGLTALDVAAMNPLTATYQKRLTWLALRYAGAPQTQQWSNPAIEYNYYSNTYRDRVNTLLFVATLIATVTFAAGFTMPGGYNSSDHDHHPYPGMATLDKKDMFPIFVLSNTMAMYSSIIVAILLIWAMLNDPHLSICSVKFAIPLLGISLSMVSLAFMAAISMVVSNVTWLSTLILIIGSVSLLGLWIVFLPLSYPNSLTHRVYRYILRYPLYLLILATEKKEKLKTDAQD